jgi:phage tail sheath protein FI
MGWTRGQVRGLTVSRKFTEGERDELVANQINPIRYKQGNLVLWGNETLYKKPSPLQLRSVAFLLIYIKYGLESFIEYKLFEFNNENTWITTEKAINAFMRDEVKARQGVYDYKVAIKDVITKSDIDNRRMPIFLGIQPTMDIKMIPITLAIYNSSQSISVSI